jgi:vacuolar-type H+-ATPase subunit B/Vma2
VGATYAGSSRSLARQRSPSDHLAFAHDFEHEFVNQGGQRRNIEETLEFAWRLLRGLPPADLKRLDPALLARYGQAADQPEVVPGAALGAH